MDRFNQAILTTPEDQITHLALDILKAEVLNALEHIRAAHGFKAEIESLVAPQHLNRASKSPLLNAVELVSGEMTLHREIYSPFQVLATTYDMGCMQTRKLLDDRISQEEDFHEHRNPRYVVVLDYQVRSLAVMVGVVVDKRAQLLGRVSVPLRQVCLHLDCIPSLPSPLPVTGLVQIHCTNPA